MGFIDCGLGTEEGKRFFRKNGLRERCRIYPEETARMLLRYLPDLDIRPQS
jgi:hypothetical protein